MKAKITHQWPFKYCTTVGLALLSVVVAVAYLYRKRRKVGLGSPDRKEEWKRKGQGGTKGKQVAWLVMVIFWWILPASLCEGEGREWERIYRERELFTELLPAAAKLGFDIKRTWQINIVAQIQSWDVGDMKEGRLDVFVPLWKILAILFVFVSSAL